MLVYAYSFHSQREMGLCDTLKGTLPHQSVKKFVGSWLKLRCFLGDGYAFKHFLHKYTFIGIISCWNGSCLGAIKGPYLCKYWYYLVLQTYKRLGKYISFLLNIWFCWIDFQLLVSFIYTVNSQHLRIFNGSTRLQRLSFL